MTITIPALSISALDQIVRLKISRAAYNTVIESLGDETRLQLTYDGATLEIMSPGSLHEIISRLVSDLLVLVSAEWEINLLDLGSTRFFPIDGDGFEADGSWYIDISQKVQNQDKIDLSIDEPPALLLETDITTDRVDRFAIFAHMGVPEVWHYDLTGFRAKALENGVYVLIQTSRVIKGLPIVEIAKRLEDKQSRSNMVYFRREWQQWLREHKHLHDQK